MKFMIHLEWKQRVPGQLLLQPMERTFEREFPGFNSAFRQVQRDYKGCVVTIRPMPRKKAE